MYLCKPLRRWLNIYTNTYYIGHFALFQEIVHVMHTVDEADLASIQMIV